QTEAGVLAQERIDPRFATSRSRQRRSRSGCASRNAPLRRQRTRDVRLRSKSKAIIVAVAAWLIVPSAIDGRARSRVRREDVGDGSAAEGGGAHGLDGEGCGEQRLARTEDDRVDDDAV